MLQRSLRVSSAIVAALAIAAGAAAQTITTPRQEFGFNIGDDYQLATYTQFADYWRKLDQESPRMQVIEIGKTEEGKPHLAAIVTAPENFAKLDRYKQIAQQMHRARGITEAQARALAKEGKAVVWIDGGLHATEVVGAHQLIETVYQLVSRTDEETTRILRDVIVVAVHANPDGMQMVTKCYMQAAEPTQRRTCTPRLYEKYAGHDNNRDFYMSNTRESQNMNKLMYWEWLPQIMYNHHQTGPAGTVIFSPPFRDPFNYNFDPMIVTGLDMVGAAMHHRFLQEGKPGFTMRSGASYSTWWNGGLRTTAYFQNIIGLLTETIGGPTPSVIPYLPERQLPDSNLFYPIAPQVWKFRQSVDYSVTANYAVLDLASRYRETFLWNIYEMGRDSIMKGRTDSWTPRPRRIAEVQKLMAADRDAAGARAQGGRGGGAPSLDASRRYYAEVHKPEQRDPRGYILPSDQADFGAATHFVNALQKLGVAVHRATAAFTVGGKQYPAGSYVVKTAQAYRPHVLDMFEPQDHPDDFPYPGGAPIPPYDSAGYTLAYQMGVAFDRVLNAFDGPFEKLTAMATVPPSRVTGVGPAPGYYFSHAVNNSFLAINRLVAAGEDVRWLSDGPMGEGTFYVTSGPSTRATLDKLAAELGVEFQAATSAPAGPSSPAVLRRYAPSTAPVASPAPGSPPHSTPRRPRPGRPGLPRQRARRPGRSRLQADRSRTDNEPHQFRSRRNAGSPRRSGARNEPAKRRHRASRDPPGIRRAAHRTSPCRTPPHPSSRRGACAAGRRARGRTRPSLPSTRA